MYKLFKVTKKETNIQGIWKDKDKDKVYYDNIEIIEYKQSQILDFEQGIRNLFSLGEICIAYKDNNNYLIIQDKKGNKEILRHQILIVETKKPTKKYIDLLLEQHSGLTIYKDKEIHTIETYK